MLYKEYSLLSCFYVTCCFSCQLFELFPNATSSLHSKECYYGHSLVKPHLIFYCFSSPNIRSTSFTKKSIIIYARSSKYVGLWVKEASCLGWFLASENKSICNCSLPIGLIIISSCSEKFLKSIDILCSFVRGLQQFLHSSDFYNKMCLSSKIQS